MITTLFIKNQPAGKYDQLLKLAFWTVFTDQQAGANMLNEQFTF